MNRMRWPRRKRFGLAFGLAAMLLVVIGALRFWLRPDPAELLLKAQAEFQAGRFEQADALLARVATIRNPTPMDRMARAQVAWAQGRAEPALAELARIPDDSTLAPLAHLLAGRIEVKRGRARAAEAHFEAVLKRDPDSVQAHRELAYLDNVQQRQSDLDREMEALSRLDALSFEYLVHWGKTRHVSWNPSDDRKELERFVATDPNDRASRLALVDGLLKLGHLDRAGTILAPLPADDPEANARRVRLALRRGNRSEVERLLSRGPADHPELAQIRGELALRSGRPGEAARQFRLALSARPDDRSLLSATATALRLSGDEAGARPFAEAARRYDKVTNLIAHASRSEWDSDPALADRLAAAIEATGRLDEARAWYRMALSRDPFDAQAQKALYRLNHPTEHDRTAATR